MSRTRCKGLEEMTQEAEDELRTFAHIYYHYRFGDPGASPRWYVLACWLHLSLISIDLSLEGTQFRCKVAECRKSEPSLFKALVWRKQTLHTEYI